MINENKMKPRYLPIDPYYIELIEEQIKKGDTRVIYFAFSKEPELDESNGKIIRIDYKKDEGDHLLFENGDEVRLDRIVVINGIPGPAYDEYDSYALAPLTCKAGYDDSFCE
jgi:hypothetical protein